MWLIGNSALSGGAINTQRRDVVSDHSLMVSIRQVRQVRRSDESDESDGSDARGGRGVRGVRKLFGGGGCYDVVEKVEWGF